MLKNTANERRCRDNECHGGGKRKQQRKFDRSQHEFNFERPHEALNMQKPASLYEPHQRLS